MLHVIAENYNNDTRRMKLQVIAAEFLVVFDCQVTFGKLWGFISDFSRISQSVAMGFTESGCYPAHVEKFCTTHAIIKFAIIKESLISKS